MGILKDFRLLVIFSALALGSFAVAAPATEEAPAVPLQFARLDLTDGRKLKEVVIKSYDADAKKILLITAGDKALLLPIDQIPQPLRDQLKEGAPRGGGSTSVVSPSKIITPSTIPGTVLPAPAPVAPPMPVSPAEDPRLQHEAVARNRAQRYYEDEFQVGSGAIIIVKLSLDTDEPEPIPGWTGRYRTTGRANIGFYESKGRSFSRTQTSTFECITEQKPGERIKVVDFSLRS